MSTIHRLKTSFITSWVWKEWRNPFSGRIILVPFWRNPNDGYNGYWERVKWKK